MPWVETDRLKPGCLDWVEPAKPPFHIMLDIESLGVTPGSVILNIGAVEFCPLSGEFGKDFYAAIDIADSQSYGCTIAADTVKWWMKQSEEARLASFGDGVVSQSAYNVLQQLRAFVQTGRKVWSHGPAMDAVLIEWLCRKVGVPIPWKYGDVRCTRTVYDMAGVTINRDKGTHHNALDDAKAQAEAVFHSYKNLGMTA